MRDEFDDLYPIFHAINRDYFCNAIQVSKVLWVKEKDKETPNENSRAYYIGNRTWGEIFLIDSPRTPRTHHRVWKSVFHEMLHQLIGTHDKDFR